MEYKLTKKSMDEGYGSRISVGQSLSGQLGIIRNDDVVKEVTLLSEISVGDEVLLSRGISDYIKTSPVTNIILLEAGRLLFNTRTSVYELTYNYT